MRVTKGELKLFLDSYGELHMIENKFLSNSLCELHDILNRFFLYGLPYSYVLKEWQYESCLLMKKNYSLYRNENTLLDLEPYFKSFVREVKLKELI